MSDYLSIAECDALIAAMDIPSDGVCGPPPPAGEEFTEYDQLYDAAQKHAKMNGYALAKAPGSTATRKRIKCDRSGPPDKKGTKEDTGTGKKRKQYSKKTDCEFFCTGDKSKDTGKWTLDVKVGTHNHPADDVDSGSPAHRIAALTRRELAAMDAGFEAHDQPLPDLPAGPPRGASQSDMENGDLPVLDLSVSTGYSQPNYDNGFVAAMEQINANARWEASDN